MTNISRDKEVSGDNALVNGQVFESVLIPQHVDDDHKKPKLLSIRVIFILASKTPTDKTIILHIMQNYALC